MNIRELTHTKERNVVQAHRLIMPLGFATLKSNISLLRHREIGHRALQHRSSTLNRRLLLFLVAVAEQEQAFLLINNKDDNYIDQSINHEIQNRSSCHLGTITGE